MTQAAFFCGIKSDIPVGLTDLAEEGWKSGVQMPDMDTLRPMSWLSTDRWKVGSVICDFHNASGFRAETSPREIARRQVLALRGLGFEPMVSALFELTIFYKNSVVPVSPHEDLSTVLSQLAIACDQSAIPIESVGLGLEPGKLYIVLKEQPALELADNVHRLRGVTRSVCGRAEYDVTFMTKALPNISSNRLHLTWRLLGSDQINVFSSPGQSSEPSLLCRHWLAGQLEHNPATCALARPTVNCYRKDGNISEEGLETESSDSGILTSCTRVVWEGGSVRLLDSTPTSASNPYLVIAAVMAAGISGITNKMELSLSESQTVVERWLNRTPQSLNHAMECLENDQVMKCQLGTLFITRFLYVKAEFEIERIEKRSFSEENKNGGDFSDFQNERDLYLLSL
ncbi:hypothetical protein EGW08_013567 [Elysia chlorotica]|uniref:Lengsin n=1 Tax=Elysia chlorotica TaxID=188477 RepID=A0A3S1BZ41_ELYCH|nr:hypothetical protein EGW08_013567 [Elysia chlorotica]